MQTRTVYADACNLSRSGKLPAGIRVIRRATTNNCPMSGDIPGSPARNSRTESKEYKVFAKGPSRLDAQERKVKFDLNHSSPQKYTGMLQPPPDLSKPTRSPKRAGSSPTSTSPFAVNRSGSPVRRQQIRELEQGVKRPKLEQDTTNDVRTISFEAAVLSRLDELEKRIAAIEEAQKRNN